MSTIQQSAGIGALVLSVLGLVLCVGGAVGVCVGKRHLDTAGTALFGAADDALDFIHTRLERVKTVLDESRNRVGLLSKVAERVKATGEAVTEELEPVQASIDQIFSEVKASEHWLEAMVVLARNVNTMSHAIAKAREDAPEGQPSGAIARRVAELSLEVVDVLARLDAVRRELVEMREKRQLARELAGRVIARAVDLDGKLEQMSQRVTVFREEVAAARVACADVKRRYEWWATFAMVVLLLVLGWFAVSQVGMVVHGWRLMRSGR